MRLGFLIPDSDHVANPEAVSLLAARSEALGFDSLWVLERELFPLRPHNPAASDFQQRPQWSPLDTLKTAAAQTERIAIGLNLINIPFFSPTMLARDLVSLDHLSNGRIQVGLGLGWAEDDIRRVMTALTESSPASEFLQSFTASWAGGEVAFQGEYFSIAKTILATPVQQPQPPISYVAFAPAAVQSSLALLSGVNQAGQAVSVDPATRTLKELVAAATPDAAVSSLTVRASVVVTPEPLGESRALFNGTLRQIQSDIATCRDLGVAEVIVDVNVGDGDQPLSQMLDGMELMYAIALDAIQPKTLAAAGM